MRARRWWGIGPGDPEVYLWGAPVELDKTDRIKTLRDRLLNQLVLNAFEMSPTRMDEYASAISSFRKTPASSTVVLYCFQAVSIVYCCHSMRQG